MSQARQYKAGPASKRAKSQSPPASPSVRESVSPDPWATNCKTQMLLECVKLPEDSYRPAHHLIQRCSTGCVELSVANPVLKADQELSSTSLNHREVITYGTALLQQDSENGRMNVVSGEGPTATLLSAKVAALYWPAFMQCITQHEQLQAQYNREINKPMPICWESNKTLGKMVNYENPPEVSASAEQVDPLGENEPTESRVLPDVSEPTSLLQAEAIQIQPPRSQLSPKAPQFIPQSISMPVHQPTSTITSQTYIPQAIPIPQISFHPHPQMPINPFVHPQTFTFPWQPNLTQPTQAMYAPVAAYSQQLQQQTQQQPPTTHDQVVCKEEEEQVQQASSEAQKFHDRRGFKRRRSFKRQEEAIARKQASGQHFGNLRGPPPRKFGGHPRGCQCTPCRTGNRL